MTMLKKGGMRIGLRDWLFFFAGAALSAVFTTGAIRLNEHTAIDWDLTTKVVGAASTAMGVVLVGIWGIYTTVRRRSLVPRAELNHKHQLWRDSDGYVLRLFIELGNPSEAMMQPGDGMTIVQVPPTAAFDVSDYSYDSWSTIAELRHAVEFEELRIEPKETEIFVHDVRLPDDVKFVQIHSWMRCSPSMIAHPRLEHRPRDPIARPEEDEAWSKTCLIDLREEMDKPAQRRFAHSSRLA